MSDLGFDVSPFQRDQEMLGKTLRVTVKVNDSEGDMGTGERMVTLSDTII